MADKDKIKPMWLDRYEITHPDDIHSLETRAALKEWQDKLPRHEAEDKAYSDYKTKELEDACAHHYSGCQAGFAAGDTEASKRHALMLTLGLKALGHDGIKVPEHIVNRSKHTPSKVYSFKNHKSDAFILGDKTKESTPDKDK